jgi:two-component system KDP operon response regulator KdpE
VTEVVEPTLRLLAVDDDPVNRALLRAIVQRAPDPLVRNAVYREAASLAAARAALADEPVDVLLLDIHLPDGLGLDLAMELRPGRPASPAVIALTASVLPAEQQAALDAGCDAFLAKPYSGSDLLAVIRRLAEARWRD